MISVVICTSEIDRMLEIERNISDTIGVAFELIIIDNSKSEYSIFQAYNMGVRKSNFPIICFMHDDIIYHSENWGLVVNRHFERQQTGMIGVGGTRFLSAIPTIWWAGGHKFFNSESGTVCHNCIDTNRNNRSESKYNLINPEGKDYTKVVVLDGLWFCIRRSLFSSINFDQRSYDGFHFYDLDISMQVNRLKYNIYCIFDIKIEHVSSSVLDRLWVKNSAIFYKKWSESLPVSALKLSRVQYIYLNFEAFRIGLNILISNKVRFPLVYLLSKVGFGRFIKNFFNSTFIM